MIIIDYKHIKRIIDKWDPMVLLHMAPVDEYSNEVKEIKAFIDTMETDDVDILASEIQNIFNLSFVEKFPYEECLEVAKQIMSKSK